MNDRRSPTNAGHKLIGGILLLATSFGGTATKAADCLETIGRWGGDGPSTAVVTNGRHTYFGGSVLHAADIAEPASPTILSSQRLSGQALDMALLTDLLFVAADSAGLLIFNVGEPGDPIPVSETTVEGDQWSAKALAVAYPRCYVGYDNISASGGMIVAYDISDFREPVEAGVFELESDFRALAHSNGLLLVGTSEPGTPDGAGLAGGLHILDAWRPNEPELAFLELGVVSGIDLSGERAVLARDRNGLSIVDFSDPENPFVTGTYDLDTPGWSANAVAVADELAFVTGLGAKSFRVFDISDPEHPEPLGDDLVDDAFDVSVAEDWAYVAGGHAGLRTVNVRYPWIPSVQDFVYPSGTSVRVEASDTHIFVADGTYGLWILDATIAEHPAVSGFVSIPGAGCWGSVCGWSLRYANEKVYLTSYAGWNDSYFHIVDVHDPSEARLLSTVNLNGIASMMHVVSNLALVSTFGDGLRIFDITDPSSPEEVGSWKPASSTDTFGFDLADEHTALLTRHDPDRLHVIDFSDPTEPASIAELEMDDPYDIAIRGDVAFVADVQGLHVMDISHPASPLEIASASGSLFSVEIAGGRAFTVDIPHWDGQGSPPPPNYDLRVWNITTPTDPEDVLYGEMGIVSRIFDELLPVGLRVYTAGGDDGMYVLDASRCGPLPLVEDEIADVKIEE